MCFAFSASVFRQRLNSLFPEEFFGTDQTSTFSKEKTISLEVSSIPLLPCLLIVPISTSTGPFWQLKREFSCIIEWNAHCRFSDHLYLWLIQEILEWTCFSFAIVHHRGRKRCYGWNEFDSSIILKGRGNIRLLQYWTPLHEYFLQIVAIIFVIFLRKYRRHCNWKISSSPLSPFAVKNKVLNICKKNMWLVFCSGCRPLPT